MADHDPSDPHAHHSEVVTAMRQATAPVATEWTTDLIHAHIEHLDGRSDPLTAATLDAMGWLLERVEALSDRLKLAETTAIMQEVDAEDDLRRLCARDDDASPNDALKAVYQRGREVRGAGGVKGRTTVPPLPTPAELAEMLFKLRLARKEVHTLPNSAGRLYGDAADVIEALTAENARLKRDRVNGYVVESGVVNYLVIREALSKLSGVPAMSDVTMDHIKRIGQKLDEARSTISRLEAEVERAVQAETDRCIAIIDEAVRGEGPLWAQPVEDPRGDREPDCSDVLDRLPTAIRTSWSVSADGWYSTMRREVEAAHAAGKEAAR